MNTEIYLIRHGETEWSRSGQHTSVTDLALTERGEQQARALRGHLQRLDHNRREGAGAAMRITASMRTRGLLAD